MLKKERKAGKNKASNWRLNLKDSNWDLVAIVCWNIQCAGLVCILSTLGLGGIPFRTQAQCDCWPVVGPLRLGGRRAGQERRLPSWWWMVEMRRLSRDNSKTVLAAILARGAICLEDLKQMPWTGVWPSTDKNVTLGWLSFYVKAVVN